MTLRSQPITPRIEEVRFLADYKLYYVELLYGTVDGRSFNVQEHIRRLEYTGEVAWLDLEMMRRAARHALETGQRTGVNVSKRSIHRHGDELITLAARAPTGRLVIEITETAAAVSADVLHRFLARLKEAGALIALDDWGAGGHDTSQANFLPLSTVEPDVVKVSGESLCADPARAARRVAAAARSGALVVAERIETPAMRQRLIELNVHAGQGWLFRALPPCRDGVRAGCERFDPDAPEACWAPRDRRAARPCQSAPVAELSSLNPLPTAGRAQPDKLSGR